MTRVTIATVLCGVSAIIVAQSHTVDFESTFTGNPPAGFTFGHTGQGKPGVWIVTKDEMFPERGHVLAQTDPDPTDYRFPLALLQGTSTADVDLSVRIRPVSGRGDQGAGVGEFLLAEQRDSTAFGIVLCLIPRHV
jgi:hypothetical protein